MMTRLMALVVALVAVVAPAATAQVPAPPPPHEHPAPAPAPAPADEHAGHVMPPATPAAAPAATTAPLPPFIPVLTDADRAAAFPAVGGHAVHDHPINYFVLFDQLEGQSGAGARALSWDARGWVGQDIHRVWFRAEGEAAGGRVESGQAHLLYGRAIARWWDVVAGVRQDLGNRPAQTWAALGVQGLAPYWFEIEATAYVSPSGRAHLRLESEYELLITNRLILQPIAEVELHAREDRRRGLGRGLSTVEAGLRLRYEFRREVAPYVGLAWHRRLFGTADQARAAGDAVSDARLAVGLRVWM